MVLNIVIHGSDQTGRAPPNGTPPHGAPGHRPLPQVGRPPGS
jgi:hypothetical protein